MKRIFIILSVFFFVSCSTKFHENNLLTSLERNITKEYCKIISACAQDIVDSTEKITICTISQDKSYDGKSELWGFTATSKLYTLKGNTAARLKKIILNPLSNNLILHNYKIRKESILKTNQDPGNDFWIKECAFNPGFALRFYYNDEFVDCLICFNCDQWQFYYDAKGSEFGDLEPIKNELQDILRKVFPKHRALDTGLGRDPTKRRSP